MDEETSRLKDWTEEQLALGRRWVRAWQRAGPELERLRREELRCLDSEHAIALLCGPVDYQVPPRQARPTSGLIEQQKWFMKASGRA